MAKLVSTQVTGTLDVTLQVTAPSGFIGTASWAHNAVTSSFIQSTLPNSIITSLPVLFS